MWARQRLSCMPATGRAMRRHRDPECIGSTLGFAMRTTCWPSVLLFAYAACGETPQRTVQQSTPQHSASPRGGLRAAGPVVVSNRNENGHTLLELQVGGS